jgi:6-pyruvoyltetrahydropterin/6-carboxytetrahydropterin synthase
LIFESETLDDRNWVMDFGGLKAFKEWADWQFDHTLCVGSDDPHLEKFKALAALGKQAEGGVVDLRIVEAVGCEKFAELAYCTMQQILAAYQEGVGWVHPDGRMFEARYPVGVGVRLRSAEVFEHAGNSAVYEG